MRYLATGSVLLLITGCASAPVSRTTPDELGFIYEKPKTGEWIVEQRPKTAISEFKKEDPELAQKNVTLKAIGQFGVVGKEFNSREEILASIKKMKLEQASRGPFEPIKNDFIIAKYKGADCLMSKQQMKDLGRSRSLNDDFIVYTEGMTCIHPKNSKRFVDMQFSQRYPKNKAPVEDGADRMSYFNSLTFR